MGGISFPRMWERVACRVLVMCSWFSSRRAFSLATRYMLSFVLCVLFCELWCWRYGIEASI